MFMCRKKRKRLAFELRACGGRGKIVQLRVSAGRASGRGVRRQARDGARGPGNVARAGERAARRQRTGYRQAFLEERGFAYLLHRP